MAASFNITGLILGRIIVGMGVGISAVVVPVYLAEVSPAHMRGRIVSLFELMLCLGMLAAALVDAVLESAGASWRIMVGLPVIPGCIMLSSMCILPESPRWLVVNDRLDEALTVLHKVLGGRKAPKIFSEHPSFPFINDNNNNDDDGNDSSGVTLDEEQQAIMERAEDALLELWSTVQRDAAATLEQRQAAELVWSLKKQRRRRDGADGNKTRGGSESSQRRHQLEPLRKSPSALELQGSSSPSSSLYIESSSHQHTLAANPFSAEKEQGQGGGGGGGYSNDDIEQPLERMTTTSTSSQQGGKHTNRSNKFSTQNGFWKTLGTMVLDIRVIASGREKKAFWIAFWLAVFNQACASTAIINYAPSLLQTAAGASDSTATFLTAAVAGSKLLGVVVSFFLVDTAGRRPLLLWGSAGAAAAMIVLAIADGLSITPLLVVGMCLFIFSFSVSWAGVFWVLLSELFSMSAKSSATSTATAVLFMVGAITDAIFLTLYDALGAYTFALFSGISIISGVYVLMQVPETKNRELKDIQNELAQDGGGEGEPLAALLGKGRRSGNVDHIEECG